MSLPDQKQFPSDPDSQNNLPSEVPATPVTSDADPVVNILGDSQELFTQPVVGNVAYDASGFPLPNFVTPNGAMPSPAESYSPDLQITWGWPHLILFIVYGLISLVLVQTALMIHYAPRERVSRQQLEQILLSKPQFAIGSMLIWYGLLFFFLYITLAVLRGHAFWSCLGWRKIPPKKTGKPRHAMLFFFAGCGLSLLVALLTSRMKPPENIPIEELFKVRQTALLFMAMAVFVAPLVEETLFRGYLYPLFARTFGMTPGIVITGVLFGMMHGAQLGWTWSLVTVLVIVGIIFTAVRARTGSVFASYLMHLGYNSLIALAAIVSTHGFTKAPGP
jgi:membrane protease YdiL (CAAX protease family)